MAENKVKVIKISIKSGVAHVIKQPKGTHIIISDFDSREIDNWQNGNMYERNLMK